MERISGVDQRAGFATLGGSGEGGEQNTGASGRIRARNFSEAAAGQAAGKCIEGDDPEGDSIGRGPDFEMRSSSDARQARSFRQVLKHRLLGIARREGRKRRMRCRDCRRRSHKGPSGNAPDRTEGKPVDIRFLFAFEDSATEIGSCQEEVGTLGWIRVFRDLGILRSANSKEGNPQGRGGVTSLTPFCFSRSKDKGNGKNLRRRRSPESIARIVAGRREGNRVIDVGWCKNACCQGKKGRAQARPCVLARGTWWQRHSRCYWEGKCRCLHCSWRSRSGPH